MEAASSPAAASWPSSRGTGSRSVLLYPLYHPAAALYTPAMLKVLESDFARLPELLGRTLEPAAAPEPELALVPPQPPAEQLGLF